MNGRPSYCSPLNGRPRAQAEVEAAVAEERAVEAARNEAFKQEVETLVRGAPTGEPQPQSAATQTAAAEAPLTLRALLEGAGLARYEAGLREGGASLVGLAALAQQQGRVALDARLREYGVRALGHRLRLCGLIAAARVN